VHENGTVNLIGASINGVGTVLTTTQEAPLVAQRVLREYAEELWSAAEKVQPQKGIALTATPEKPGTPTSSEVVES